MAKKFRKGMELFHEDTKLKVIFGKYNDDGSAACITKDNRFITISKEELDHYISYASIEKEAKERRRGQAW